MLTKTKLALAIALILSTSSAVLAAPHTAYQGHVSAAEQNWFDRASAPDTGGAN
jgi:hypothetical protein